MESGKDRRNLCDISTRRPRPFVPKCFRRNIFEMIHTLSYPSIRATVQLVTEKFVWHAMKKDIRAWTRTCVSCQRSQIHRHTKASLGSFQQPTRRFGHIHVDIVGPLPSSEEKRYLFKIIDRSTRWLEAIPMEDATTVSCATALLDAWISRFGLPEYITSDRGSVFTSDIWSSLAQLLGVPTPHNVVPPPGKWNRGEMAQNIESITHSEMFNFGVVQPATLGSFGDPYHAQRRSDLFFCRNGLRQPLVVPGEIFPYDSTADQSHVETLRRIVRDLTPCRPSKQHQHTTSFVPAELKSSDCVFIREDVHKPPLSNPYRGPYRVLARTDKSYRVQLDNKEDWISIDRLKPAYLDVDDHNRNVVTRSGRTSRLVMNNVCVTLVMNWKCLMSTLHYCLIF